MSIDHIGLKTASLATARAFYLRALAPLDFRALQEIGNWTGLGSGSRPSLWLVQATEAVQPVHLAFTASTAAQVRDFFDAALAAGATVKDPPQLFPIYHANFYAAQVLDPDGNTLEVVCHGGT